VKRALTGIKPTGNAHIGNWLGAIRPAIELQESYEAYYFIADYHAMTTVHDPEVLRRSSLEHAAGWLALGLDPKRTVLFRQSAIPVVQELTWMLSCYAPVGLLERGHAVKSAREAGKDINVGTWMYPMLMAADILLYDVNVVPVGRDQRQHVEICRDLAQSINHRYGEDTFVVPDAAIREDVGVIPGLDGRKMSASYGNEIPLWLDAKQLRKMIGRIKTDSLGVDDIKDPDACGVFALYRLVASEEQVMDLRERYLKPGLGYGHAKAELFEVLNGLLSEPRERYHAWLADPGALEDVLADGAKRATNAAEATMHRVRHRMGLR